MNTVKLVGKPYSRLLKMIDGALAGVNQAYADSFDVAAVCIQESRGEPFFIESDSLFRDNSLALHVGSGASVKAFVDTIRVKHGPNQGSIPKFKFESLWYRLVLADERFAHLSRSERAFYACAVGVAQQSIWHMLPALEQKCRHEYILAFAADPAMQIRHLHGFLSAALKDDDSSKAMVFTRYNSGQAARHVSGYGWRVAGIEKYLREQWSE